MILPQYVSTPERSFTVVGVIDDEMEEQDIQKLENGKGYIDSDENIWIYCQNGKPKNPNAYPYFWFDENNKRKKSDPPEEIKNLLSVKKMINLDFIEIINTTKDNEELYDEEAILDMNAAADVYKPVIDNIKDDFMKKIVKLAIRKKNIDINRLKVKTGEKYQLPNMKAALSNTTNMSVKYFNNWMELLGCSFSLLLYDNGTDTVDPLVVPIQFQSDSGLKELVNGEWRDININQYTEKEDDEENEN